MQVNSLNNSNYNLVFRSNVLEQKKLLCVNRSFNNNDKLVKKTKKVIKDCIFTVLGVSVVYFALKRSEKYKKIENYYLRQIRKAKLPVPFKDFTLNPFIGR